MRLFTFTMSSGGMVISKDDGVTQITIQANASSSCSILGNIPFAGVSPNALTISDGQALTIEAPTQSPLDGVTITHISGSIDIVIGL